MPTLKLGTRGSQLALFQANAVAALLRARADVSCDVVVIRTSGDRLADAALAQIGGKRLFVKEIEDALLAGAIDLAVHSSKDMPAVLPDGLALGAVLPREDPRDAIVLPAPGDEEGRRTPPAARPLDAIVRHLDKAPQIGTSSIRRTAQLRRLLPGARFGTIRGNLDTRLRKLDSGGFDAIVLAAAGLRRLGYDARISAALPIDVCVPAPGQGIIAVEVRRDDAEVRRVVESVNDSVAAAALAAEWMVVRRLGGGCQMPIGAYASVSNAELSLTATVISIDGERAVRAEASGAPSQAEAIGAQAATRLLAQGAAEILAEANSARGAVEGLQP
ncbi:MAG: hydroxymethylbilane synthase [Vicinamibacterales bacterium]